MWPFSILAQIFLTIVYFISEPFSLSLQICLDNFKGFLKIFENFWFPWSPDRADQSFCFKHKNKFLPSVGAQITCTGQLDTCLISLGQIRVMCHICMAGSKPTTCLAIPRVVRLKHYCAQGQECNQTVQKHSLMKQYLVAS